MSGKVLGVVGTIILLVIPALYAAEIHDAVEAGNVVKVQQLLSADATLVNAQNESGTTPLHLAAGLNNTNLVQFLIAKGANIKAATKQGWTALHWAAYLNAADATVLLLAKGADSQVKASDERTPLQIAITENSQDVVAILAKQTTAVYTDKAIAATYAEAEKARLNGDLKQAYEMFSKLVNNDPANEKYNFALGMTCYAMEEYSRGQFAFERVLQKNPDNGRARVELARCLMGLGQDAAAKKEFKKILTTNPPAEVKRKIKALITEMEKKVKRWQFSGRVDVMAFDDDNVNVGPDSERISIAPIIFGSQSIDELTVQQTSQPAKSKGYAGSIFAGAVYDAGDPGKWGWGTTAAYYQNQLNDRSQNESLFYQCDTGARYLADRRYWEAPLRVAHISTGNKSLVNMYGIHPAFMYAYGPSGEWRLGTLTSFERRDYSTLDDRDGVYVSAGEMIRHYFGEKKHSVIIGVFLSHDFTKADVYEYNGLEWQFGTEIKLPWQTIAYGRIRNMTSNYAGKELLAPSDRKDTQRQYMMGLSKMITSRWGVDVNYQVTDNTSTFTLYQYDRHVATLSTFCIF
ncbi:MAG: ankyrin repeat domain-containing protein [Kiritimatiellae bacterium]|nr:ankyrin repeat domain-containing protein [Kiritimatiellia bacterium]MDD5521237.1 ankyrin repeat domain-containing protein [Kiritimatiellia bacterium]